MNAVILKDQGDASQLTIQEVANPSIDKDEILVKTKAFSINPIDYKIRRGISGFTDKLLQNPPSILGWDAAGVIEQVGTDCGGTFQIGDKVYGVIGFPKFGKTYAEYFVCTPKDICFIPENLNFEQAACSGIAGLTAYQALSRHADLKPGKKILIHAASGGVGHFGVQIAKSFGAEVWATSSRKNHGFLKELGVDHLIDYKTEVFEKKVANMDVVFDLMGGDYIDRSLKTLAPGGTIISIPSATNAKVVEKAEAQNLKGVRYILEADKTDLEALTDLLATGKVKPFVSKTYSIHQIREAHKTLEEGHTQGKIAVFPH